jgi:hypothetical protein
MTTSTIYWNVGPDLGTYRISNNYNINLSVVDPEPSAGSVVYSLISGTLPPYLQLSTSTGYVWGYAEYQAIYTTSSVFTISATKIYNTGTTYSTSSAFIITLKGFVDENIQWVSDSDLGSIYSGYTSELFVKAEESINNNPIKYALTTGTVSEGKIWGLPSGLSLTQDGAIVGQVNYGVNTATYEFYVSATTSIDRIGKSQKFTLFASDENDTKYTKIYFRPFLSIERRKEYQLFINNPDIFDTKLIYRYFDPNFGVQSEIKTILDFGIEQVPLDQYTQALRQNFYKRRFTLGKIKTAVAKDDSGKIIYEVIYADVVDNLSTAALTLYSTRIPVYSLSGSTAGQIVYGELDPEVDSIYYPASIKNMRTQLSRIQLDDYSTIQTNRFLEPRFMQTAQDGSILPTNYIHVVPLCYTLPGKSKQIQRKIQASGFEFNMIDFEVDRILVQTSLDNTSTKYLLFGRESISDTLSTDTDLYQGDVFWQFDDGVQITRTT